MAQRIAVEDGKDPLLWCRELEKGNILFFSAPPFPFPQNEIDFLLEQRQGRSKGRKNIAYKPQKDVITNHDPSDRAATQKLHEILRNYSFRVTSFLAQLLAPYAQHWKCDYASFRPFQEKGRKLRLRARNDLLHIDAFPTRPLHGWRILRFFTNINPTQPRRWVTSQSFEELAQQFGGKGALSFPSSVGYSWSNRLKRALKHILRRLGWKIPLRSPYDTFMLQLHNFLKENRHFQRDCPKDYWDFPPNSYWIVFTDQVSHAALSGQYALEQTFLVPRNALLFPDQAPVSILERLSGRNMVDPLHARSFGQ